MMRYMLEGGFAMWPILLIAVAIAILVLVNTVRLFGVRKADERTRSSINAILFWGVVAVVIGLFGQWSGLYKVATALVNAHLFNPKALILGFSETLISTIAGLAVFTVAAPCWFVLHARCRALCSPGLSESRDDF